MRLPALCLVAGGALGGLVARWYSAEPPEPQQIRIPFAVVTEIPERTLPSVRTVRVGCTEAPERIGTPLAKLPPAGSIGTYWQVAAATNACVIVAWQGARIAPSKDDAARIVASWDDGVTFSPIVESNSPIVGAAVRADGTIFVMREDATLAIVRPDGSVTVRTLAFHGEPRVRGRWLVVVTEMGPAISDDEGVSWRHLGEQVSYLVDLQIHDDGAIVALFDASSEVCDHFDCHGPTQAYLESHLDGRPWRPASRRHARSLDVARAAAEPRSAASAGGWGVLDSHRLIVGVAADGSIVRDTRSGWRLLYGGTP
jgi:hypothetical protein